MGLTPGQLSGRITKWNLHRHPQHRAELRADHPSVLSGHTVFRRQVQIGKMILRPGKYQVKLGNRVEKGHWRGMPIYALTLEERATCPRGCPLWVGCYGNNMHHAKRTPHGPAFELMLWRELAALQQKHGGTGFVVRLHILGDFYSPSYVDLWEAAIDHFRALHVFGYTAWSKHTEIGKAVARLRHKRWDRFAVRTSHGSKGPRTLVVPNAERKPRSAIICPAQTGATRSCGTCGLCWSAAAKDRPIAFLKH